MGKNAIVGQSGGPTSVINSSLAGVYESCIRRGAEHVYGKSITDPCLGWEQSEALLYKIAEMC